MRPLIIGQTGQLARALAEKCPNALFLNRAALDLSNPADKLEATLDVHLNNVDVVIIAAAYTAVDAAEDDYETALAVNGTAPGIIALRAAARGIPVVHISTDYVFKGDACEPYSPDDPTDPLNAYGRSKAIGERAVLEANSRSAVLRTSWVYDASGKNFLTTMLRLAETRESLQVVADQIGRPTFAPDLAQACLNAAGGLLDMEQKATGIFHVSNTGDPISWADFARAIFNATQETRPHNVTVNDIPTSQYPTLAARPAYSVMNTRPFEQTFGFTLPSWKDGLSRALLMR